MRGVADMLLWGLIATAALTTILYGSQGLGLSRARLQPDAGQARPARLFLEPGQDPPAEAQPTGRRSHEHPLHLAVAVRVDPEGAAADRLASAASHEEADVRRRQLVERQEVIALRRVESRQVVVQLSDQLRDVGLARRFPGQLDVTGRRHGVLPPVVRCAPTRCWASGGARCKRKSASGGSRLTPASARERLRV